MEEVARRYVAAHPQYCVVAPRRVPPVRLDQRCVTVLDYALAEAQSSARPRGRLDLLSAVATCEGRGGAAHCQVCEQGRAQPARYTCVCGLRYCGPQCYQAHRRDCPAVV